MYLIEEGLYQGAAPKQEHSEVDAFISLAYPLEVKNAIFGEPEYHLWLPIEDGPFPGISWLKIAVGMVEMLRNNQKNVYIHCRGGISRSVMLTAAYLMKKHKYSVDKALNLMADKNPSIDPAPRFILGLKEYFETL